MVTISCIVEGHGEVDSIPILIRRVSAVLNFSLSLEIKKPIRVPKNKFLKVGELERAVQLGIMKAGVLGSLLIVLDADKDCPARLGPEVLKRAQDVRPDFPIGVVIANKEYESWFLASIDSLKGQRGLTQDLFLAANPESIQGAKEWLNDHMKQNYRATLDQPALTALFDLEMARKSADSFDKCFREIEKLLRTHEKK